MSNLPRAAHFRARSQAVGNLLTEKAQFVIVIRKVYKNRSNTCTLTVRLWLLWRKQTSVIDRLQCRTVNHVTSRIFVLRQLTWLQGIKQTGNTWLTKVYFYTLQLGALTLLTQFFCAQFASFHGLVCEICDFIAHVSQFV